VAGGWRTGKMAYDWEIGRQRTEREPQPPDRNGAPQHWESYLAHGTEDSLPEAKRAALAAMRDLRAAHIAAGGDVGYGDAPTGDEIRALAPTAPAAEPGKTSGLLKAGDMQDGYQAVAQAPVGILGNERTRSIDGHLVSGSWSDPWWMLRQGGGWAVSRRWKNAEQTGFGGWDQASNRYLSVKIPARDERVLTEWHAPPACTGATEAQARRAERGA
jgi:hypothetical protein